jgi:hypothetical protein
MLLEDLPVYTIDLHEVGDRVLYERWVSVSLLPREPRGAPEMDNAVARLANAAKAD